MEEQVIARVAAAANMRALYPANHPRVVEVIGQIASGVHDTVEGSEPKRDSVTFLIVGNDLVIGQNVIRKTTLTQRQFIQALKRRGIERMTIADGVTPDETVRLIEALAGIAPVPPSSQHIVLGQVQLGDNEKSKAEQMERKELTSDQIDLAREGFEQFRSTQSLPIGAMEQMIWGFIDSMSRSTKAMLPLAKLRDHDEYTFVHSVNVSLLVMAQARSYGIEGTMLHSFGMAGLLHDVGKLFIPLDVLNKPGKLEGDEWATVQGHAAHGAWYLSGMEGTLPLAITTAYEHHLRYDSKPSYPLLKTKRMPHLASRMTSIADAFDAMMTVRPYQKPKMAWSALEILEQRAGTFYDPLLTGNFIRLMQEQNQSRFS